MLCLEMMLPACRSGKERPSRPRGGVSGAYSVERAGLRNVARICSLRVGLRSAGCVSSLDMGLVRAECLCSLRAGLRIALRLSSLDAGL